MSTQVKPIAEGQRTRVIYGLIRDGNHQAAIAQLNQELQFCPQSRAMSLLAYCYFMVEDYGEAARVYEQLVRCYPDVEEYRLYLAQSYYKNGDYDFALKAANEIQDRELQQRQKVLLALVRYEKEELGHAKTILRQCEQEDPDVAINDGCILFKQQKYDQARVKFQSALNAVGYNSQLAYNIALCYYRLKHLAPSLKHIAEIIENGVREHPQLGVGSYAPGVEMRSVGNSQTLRDTALVEAFNLKAAIEYSLKNFAAAREALQDMPPREESELDAVTLMNHALMNIDEEPTGGFKKLSHLLENPPAPPETFPNLLILYCKFGYYDLAADILAENSDLTYRLHQDDFEYIDALILSKASPAEAFRKFELLAGKRIEQLRGATKSIQDARIQRDNEGIRKSLKEFDECLEKYIPILMAQSKIYWDAGNYAAVENLFRQSQEFCADHEVWKLNFAHVFFVLDHFREAIKYYEPVVKKCESAMLQLTAIIVANLCVSYIMINENEQAEEIMRKLEREEEKAGYEEPGKSVYHLCIVNLVIGTLYCSKDNYEFGISRIIKSLEPYSKKINMDTWFYSKKCFLALLDKLAKHMLLLKDSSVSEILDFLDAADQHGRRIPTQLKPLEAFDEKCTVSYEAREIKRVLLKLR